MKNVSTNRNEVAQTSESGLLIVEQFLQENYLFRRNVLNILTSEYPSLQSKTGLKVKLGLAMKELGFEQSRPHNVAHYKVIPKVPEVSREAA